MEKKFNEISSATSAINDLIWALKDLPSSRELSLAMTKLEEAEMWLNKVILR